MFMRKLILIELLPQVPAQLCNAQAAITKSNLGWYHGSWTLLTGMAFT